MYLYTYIYVHTCIYRVNMKNVVIDHNEICEYDIMHEKMHEQLKEKKIKGKNENEKNIEKIEKSEKNDKKNENGNLNTSLMAIPLTQLFFNSLCTNLKGISIEEQKELCLCLGPSVSMSEKNVNSNNYDTNIEFILQLGIFIYICVFTMHKVMYIHL
jgi:hypothetical protein